jgi:hypothetical protein
VVVDRREATVTKRQTSKLTMQVRKELLKARAEMKAAQTRTLKLRQQAEAKASEMAALRQAKKPMRSS